MGILVKAFEHKGKTVQIYVDDNPDSPRDWDNLGEMVCFHQRYTLGDKTDYKSSDFNSYAELKAQIEKDHDPVVILPVYMFDHSGIALATLPDMFQAVDGLGWDWGQVGFIFCSKAKALEGYMVAEMTDEIKEKIKKTLEGEIETYNQYLSGEVFRFEILDAKGEHIDSCCGIYGRNYVEEEAMAACQEAEDPEEDKASQKG